MKASLIAYFNIKYKRPIQKFRNAHAKFSEIDIMGNYFYFIFLNYVKIIKLLNIN